MEFHISRSLRDTLQVDDLLFSYAGNVVFGDVAASRKLAQRLNEARGAGADPAKIVNAGALFAMGLIDEMSHALVAHYRKTIDPAVLTEAVGWLTAQTDPVAVERLLLTFTEQFPNVAIYRGEITAKQWLAGSTEGMSNREAALEEMLLLWLANLNPAFKPFHELFADAGLKQQTIYQQVTQAMPTYFQSRPPLSPEAGSLLDALRAPMLASPDSLTGQLEVIRERWAPHLGDNMRRALLAIDVLREEDIAIWMRFNPAGPDNFRHGAPGRGGEGFVGDEYIGFEQDYVIGKDGVRRLKQYASDHQAPLVEYEAFSPDQAWMPTVVLMAKSTYVWLEQLSKKYQRHIHRLDQIPDEELRLLADRGITGLWLIGLWERSTASKTIKRLRGHADAVASAYSLKDYRIADDLGGNSAYESLRDRAALAGLRLASDMVPNHMGIDSDWVIEHPDWFVSRWESPFPVYSFNGPDLSTDSRVEIKIEDHYYDQTDAAVVFRLRHHSDGSTRYMYHGNDGTTFAWNDTAQLDYSKALVREAVMQTILYVARLFPIIRFDAAMVLAKRHVQRLWFPLPGVGGSIPSRAENAMSQEEFDALMPNEFWREVVDRVAVEVPGTLLLAEAFWLLEGYFVRTLGMHRVYNSAFMNMLRDEENAKYRSYLKKTIEFDPDILKRYVNFMSNPDERTTIDQFGSGDKCFGTATLLATLPGLPMFAHGQIEGYGERYGMEFKQAKMNEWPNDDLVARHQREIAPLLHNRQLFAESTHFVLYDFWNEHGSVDENVFAYSNRSGAQRAIILYNNAYSSTRGTIHISAASMDKGSGELRQRNLSEALALPGDPSVIVSYRDPNSGLEYLRYATDFQNNGLTVELRGYQYIVLLDWQERRSTAQQPWDRLCDALQGQGVRSLQEALSELRTRPLHEALRHAITSPHVAAFVAAAEEICEEDTAEYDFEDAVEAERVEAAEEVEKALAKTDLESAVEEIETPSVVESPTPAALKPFLEAAKSFFDAAAEVVPAGTLAAANSAETFATDCERFAFAAANLPRIQRSFSTAWPAEVPQVLPGETEVPHPEAVWAPILAWLLIRSLPVASPVEAYDRLQLRSALAAIFASMGIVGEDSWRSAARVRLLLAHGSPKPGNPVARTEAFWADPDVRWLSGLNEYKGETYLNQESLHALLIWLELPALLEAAEQADDHRSLLVLTEGNLADELQLAENAGYELDRYLGRKPAKTPAIDEIAEPEPVSATPVAP